MMSLPAVAGFGIPELPHARHIAGTARFLIRRDEDLSAPVQDVGDEESAVGVESEEVRPGELPRGVTGLAKGADDLTVFVEFHDAIIAAVGHPDVTVRAEAEPVRIADFGPLLEELALGVEDLDALVFAIGDVDALFLVDQDAVRQVELTGPAAITAP